VANISITGGTLVSDIPVEKERKEVVETIATVNDSNVSVKRGTLVMKRVGEMVDVIQGGLEAMEKPQPTAPDPDRPFYQSFRGGITPPTQVQTQVPSMSQPEVEESPVLDATITSPQIETKEPPVLPTPEVKDPPAVDAASGGQPTDGKVDYKDPTDIPLPDSLEVTGLTGAQKILEKIAIGEGATVDKLNQQKQFGIGTSKYDMVYNYGKSLAPSKPVSTMTLSELYDFQTNLINATKGKVKGTTLGTSAVGKYQIIRTSLFGSGTAESPEEKSWAKKLGLKADTVFSPEVQEQIGMLALKEAGLQSFIEGTRNENQFQDRIANIWASVATSSGQDVYGQGVATFKKDLRPLFQQVKDENKPDDFSDPTEVPEARGEPIRPRMRPEQ